MRRPVERTLSHRERVDHDLLRRYHDHHDLRARDAVTERCMPLVRSIAWAYHDRGEDLDDLVQAGAVGLVKAVERFDPAAGTRFVSFAAPTISGEIKRHFRDHTWAVHVPRSVQELAMKVNAATSQVIERTGREPTRDELAAHLGTTSGGIDEARAGSRAYRPVSLDQPADDEVGPVSVPVAADPGYEQVEDRDLIAWAARGLDARSRCMVDARWIDDRVQREIATDHGVSPMLVSKTLARALGDMHDRVRSGGVLLAPPPGASPPPR